MYDTILTHRSDDLTAYNYQTTKFLLRDNVLSKAEALRTAALSQSPENQCNLGKGPLQAAAQPVRSFSRQETLPLEVKVAALKREALTRCANTLEKTKGKCYVPGATTYEDDLTHSPISGAHDSDPPP